MNPYTESTRNNGVRPHYFLSNASHTNLSDPNSLRDMGKVRNCVYSFDDDIERIARNMTWEEVEENDRHLKNALRARQK